MQKSANAVSSPTVLGASKALGAEIELLGGAGKKKISKFWAIG
jgi:hypothetical protein